MLGRQTDEVGVDEEEVICAKRPRPCDHRPTLAPVLRQREYPGARCQGPVGRAIGGAVVDDQDRPDSGLECGLDHGAYPRLLVERRDEEAAVSRQLRIGRRQGASAPLNRE